MDGVNGFRVDGTVLDLPWSGQWAGFGSQLIAGDVNGDGVKDLLIADWTWNYSNGNGTGAVFVIFGEKLGAGYSSPWPYSHADVTTGGTIINGTNGFQLTAYGAPTQEYASSIAVGDVNKDGYADILISTLFDDWPDQTDDFVVFGHSGVWGRRAAMQNWDDGSPAYHFFDSATRGVSFAASNCPYGSSVSTGDINGAGIGDIVISYPNTNNTYVYFGKTSGWTSPVTFDTSALASTPFDGTHGFEITGGSGFAGGDITGNGKAALLFPNSGATEGAGALYGIYGKSKGWSNTQALSNLDN